MKMISESTVPGAYLCDLIPISTPNQSRLAVFLVLCPHLVKFLPSWLPFQHRAKQGKDMIAKLVDMPFDKVKLDMVSTLRTHTTNIMRYAGRKRVPRAHP